MGPAYYVIAILGCADGSEQCAPVATVPTHYATEEACSAAAPQALAARSDLDFPTLVARCSAVKSPASASDRRPARIPADARGG